MDRQGFNSKGVILKCHKNRSEYGNGNSMERKPIKARPKMDSMGIPDSQMETATQNKLDYMVGFLLIIR